MREQDRWSWLAVAWMLGIALAEVWGPTTPKPGALCVLAGVCLLLAWLIGERWTFLATPARLLALLSVVASSAAWCQWRLGPPGAGDIRSWLEPASSPRLLEVRGRVLEVPRRVDPGGGAFHAFGYRRAETHWELKVQAVRDGAGWHSARGRLLVQVREEQVQLGMGERLEVLGWVSPFQPAANPGELDFAALMHRRGIGGRLSLAGSGTIRPLPPDSWGDQVARLRGRLVHRTTQALMAGVAEGTDRQALIAAVLVGRTPTPMQDLRERFQRVGLAHLLAISGAHLMILLGLIGWVMRIAIPHPRWAALAVLAVLLLYLLIVPPQVPILRAGMMAAVVFLAIASGRKVRGQTLLALAALLILFCWPQELMMPGFQLSFLAVWALIRFTPAATAWFWHAPAMPDVARRWDQRFRKLAAEAFAVGWVASLMVMPVVAWHFRLVHPLISVAMSFLSTVPMLLVLGLGYAKILFGWLGLEQASWLGPLISWATDGLITLVRWADRVPGMVFLLRQPPSLAWTMGMLAVLWAWFEGFFRGRPRVGGAAALLLLGWLILLQFIGSSAGLGLDRLPRPPGLSVTMLSVGNGSAFLVRSADQAMLFDGGSQDATAIGVRVIGPALRELGVRRLNWLVVSHADFDHYCGLLDAIEGLRVDAVLVPEHVPQIAEAYPLGPVAFFLRELVVRGLTVQVIAAGWGAALGQAQMEALWPPRGAQFPATNDMSLVMAFSLAGHRLLLNGDIQQQAITELLKSGVNLNALVTDLPHHGSFVAASPQWLRHVHPQLVLQSCGPARLERDPWPAYLPADTTRLITARDGAVEVRMDASGALQWSAWRDGAMR